MNLAEFLTLTGLAFVDALNPFSIAAMAFLLSTDRPIQRGLAFVIGTVAVYFLGGVVLLEGWLVFLKTLLPTLAWWVPGSLEVSAGTLAVGAGIYTWARAAKGKATPSPSNLSIAATFAFAIASTISDIPTAIPYFAAASQIAVVSEGELVRFAWLAFYNAIYAAPLIAMLAMRLAFSTRADATLDLVRQAVDWTFAKLLPPIIILAGLALLADGLRRLSVNLI